MGLGDEEKEAGGNHGEVVHQIRVGENLLVAPQTVCLQRSEGGREGAGKDSDPVGLKEKENVIFRGKVLTEDVQLYSYVGQLCV